MNKVGKKSWKVHLLPTELLKLRFGGQLTHQVQSDTRGGTETESAATTSHKTSPPPPPLLISASPYFNMDCSFASSFFCRSMTPRMIFLSSSVKWLRSGSSGMAPAAEGAAAAGPGPPRGPCGADILHTGCIYRGGRKELFIKHITLCRVKK